MTGSKLLQIVGISLVLSSASLSASAQEWTDNEPALPGNSEAALQRMMISGKVKFSSSNKQAASPHLEPQALPHWTGSFVVSGANRAGDRQNYSYTMVGTDPSQGSATTTVRTILVPLRVQFADGTVFDPSSDSESPLNTSVINNLLNSPIFKPSPVYSGGTNLGNTQYSDGIQRGSFWNTVSRRAPDYHVLLKPEVYATQTLVMPAKSSNSLGVRFGFLDDSVSQPVVLNVLAQIHDPSALVIFVLHNIVACGGGCLGYHDALPDSSGQLQTYILTSYLDPTLFGGNYPDIGTTTHEVSEWMSDPFGDNIVPPWNFVHNPYGFCSSGSPALLEVGDPVEFLPALNYSAGGITWHPQDIVFLPWFQGASTSTSVNGWYTFANSTSSPAEPCSTPGDYGYTTLNFPQASATRAFGVNNHDNIVGSYRMPGHTHGFLYLNSQFTSLDVPGSVWTTATSINDRGDVVGNFSDSKGFIHGFSYTNGVFHIIDVPGAQFTAAFGINNQGVIVGYSLFGAVAQSYQLSGNSFTMISLPFSSDSFAFGINNSGTMVGGYDNGVEADNYGFFGSPGNFVPFGFPGFESQTLPVGVNSRKDVVGTYYDPFVSGFAWIGQTFQRLNAPGAFYTFLNGINDRGMIVGSYRNRSGTHAVLLNPAGK